MIKDIVVNLSLGAPRDVAADYAVSVATALEAHLAGVAFAHEPVAPGTIFDGVSASIVATYRAQAEQAAKTAVARFEETARRAPLPATLSFETRILPASIDGAGVLFGRLARGFDLSIVSQSEPDGGAGEDLIIEGALFGSGRPVLVVPYIQSEAFKLDRVLLCWDGSRSAARAVADALPLLERSKSIEIVTIATKDDNQGEIPGADIAHHLARHRLKVELKRIVAPDTDVAEIILSHAADSASDFIVMGGYGHSRLREFVLGGATRGMLGAMTVPTLMSH